MKRLILPAAAALLFAAAAKSDLGAQDAESASTAWNGPKWEYRALRIEDRRQRSPEGTRSRGSASEAKLNELGAQGWELVAVRNDGNSSQPVFYFKRPKK